MRTQLRKELHRNKILETHKEEFPSLEVLKPTMRYHDRPSCSHTLTKPLQNGTFTCTSRAAYKVNGKLMCERHAGRELLIAHLRSMGRYKEGAKLG